MLRQRDRGLGKPTGRESLGTECSAEELCNSTQCMLQCSALSADIAAPVPFSWDNVEEQVPYYLKEAAALAAHMGKALNEAVMCANCGRLDLGAGSVPAQMQVQRTTDMHGWIAVAVSTNCQLSRSSLTTRNM